MIEEIRLCVNHRSRIGMFRHRSGGDEIGFSPGYNVIIGPNGSGKTTLLDSLYGCGFCQKEGKADMKYITSRDISQGLVMDDERGMRQGVISRFRSYGQNALMVLGDPGYSGEDCILMDSPELGQDEEHCRLLGDGLRRLSGEYQLIVATHEPALIAGADNIIELETGYLDRLIKNKRDVLNGFPEHGQG